MSRVRVIVVDDSLTVRRRICEILGADEGIEVVAEAEDGKRAIELCRELRPDVMTLDMVLPVMSGLAATEYIMAHVPTPILIVSGSANRGEVFKTYDALAAGAVDVLEKPDADDFEGAWEARLTSAVKLVARIRVITHLRARLAPQRQPASAPGEPMLRERGAGPFDVIGLGASTGGPGALVEVLRGLPTVLPIPVLIVLHIDEPFSAAFADWLGGQTGHRVDYPREGELLDQVGGRVIMGPPGRHLALRAGRLQLLDDPPRHSCRPSVDALFESLARERGAASMACLLTGMGRDGAQGLLEIHRAGGFTIAQDEQTSVVYGMPREAVLLGAAERVLPLPDIGAAMTRILEGSRRKQS